MRRGVPDALRGDVWQVVCGAKDYLRDQASIYKVHLKACFNWPISIEFAIQMCFTI